MGYVTDFDPAETGIDGRYGTDLQIHAAATSTITIQHPNAPQRRILQFSPWELYQLQIAVVPMLYQRKNS